MRRQASRYDEDDVEALLVLAIGRIAADPELGRPGDATGLAGGNRGLSLQLRRSPLDLDEGQPAAAPGDDIDLAIGRAEATRQDAVPPRQQRRSSEPFRDTPAPVAPDPFRVGRPVAHDPPSAI